MAIIAENQFGWFICSETYFNQTYKLCLDEISFPQKLKIKSAFFDIRTPFLMDSMSKKFGEKLQSKSTAKAPRAKRKKKTLLKNQLEDSEIINFILEVVNDFITSARRLGYLENSELTPEEWFKNNGNARKLASEVLHYVDSSLNSDSGLHSENMSLYPTIQKLGNEKYVIPSQSIFHLCDISAFIKTVDKKFDLMVIDPPWVNKSVKRKNSYCSLEYELLEKIPFEKLANPGCLIVVWITNSCSTESFVLEKLFPKYNISISSIWHWCKVTKKGDFVYPIESHHKKPYENLILGRVPYSNNINIKPTTEIGPKKLIVSVPSSIHSHKPPLVEILKQFVKPNAHCLELFARNLLPGWNSVGNEVLKLQHVELFNILPESIDK